jgi:hypothetical protein
VGKVGTDGKYIYANSPVIISQGNYDGKQEALADEPECPNCPETPTPCLDNHNENVIFFEKQGDWGTNVQIYIYQNNTPLFGSWDNCPSMTLVGGNLYKWNFTGTVNNWQVLFHAGGQQCPGSGQPGWTVQNRGFYKSSGFISLVAQTCEELQANIENSVENQIVAFSSDNAFHFYSNATNITAVRIYDISGKFIYGENCNTNILLLNSSNFAKAVYIAVIYTDKGIVRKKLMK